MKRPLPKLVVLLLGITLSSCSGCQESLLDSFDERVRYKPTRTGKVSTLHALETASRAREIAREIGDRLDSPCQIGWNLDEEFAITQHLELEISQGRLTRSFQEKATFLGAPSRVWSFEAHQDFHEDELKGTREVRYRGDQKGLYQWLGPEQVTYLESPETSESLRQEFASRFHGLMTLLSPEWAANEDGRLRPGSGSATICGPLQSQGQDGWQTLLRARGEVLRGEVRREERCRILEAELSLRHRGKMELRYEECFQEDVTLETLPEELRPVLLTRTRERQDLSDLLKNLIDEGILIPRNSVEPD